MHIKNIKKRQSYTAREKKKVFAGALRALGERTKRKGGV